MESSRLFRLSPRGESGFSVRAPERELSGRERRWGSDKPITVAVVDTMEDLRQVFFLRTGVSLGRRVASQATEIDDTDFDAMHLLGWLGDDPSGSLRVRVEGGHALIDRFVIKRSKSRSMMAAELIDAAIHLSRAKGATTIVCDESVAAEFPVDMDAISMRIDLDDRLEMAAWNSELDRDGRPMTGAHRIIGS